MCDMILMLGFHVGNHVSSFFNAFCIVSTERVTHGRCIEYTALGLAFGIVNGLYCAGYFDLL